MAKTGSKSKDKNIWQNLFLVKLHLRKREQSITLKTRQYHSLVVEFLNNNLLKKKLKCNSNVT